MAFRNLFSFLFQRSSTEERVAAYVIREHDRGRDLAEILEDRYVQNRLNPEQRARLLDRPEVIKAIGKDTSRTPAGPHQLDGRADAALARAAQTARRRSRRPTPRARST